MDNLTAELGATALFGVALLLGSAKDGLISLSANVKVVAISAAMPNSTSAALYLGP